MPFKFNPFTDRLDIVNTPGGSGDIVGPASSTDNALARFDGTTGKLLQNSNATLSDAGALTLAVDLAVSEGGTGASTLTNRGVLIGQGTSAIVASVAGLSGQVFQSGGAGTNPGYSTATYPSTATVSGKVLIANGTNWVASTPTFPTTAGTSGNVLTSNGTNWLSSAPTLPAPTPVFSSSVYTAPTNITGDGTQYQVIFDHTYVNTGSAYSTSTGVFTVPTTGTYQITANITINNVDVTHTSYRMSIYVAGGPGPQVRLNPGVCKTSDNSVSLSVSEVIPLAASAQVMVLVRVAGGAATVGVRGADDGFDNSYFSATKIQ